MCEFFSAVVHKTKGVLFTEENSHEDIIRRAKLKDNSTFSRQWIRVELLPNDIGGFQSMRVDERETLPAWFEDERRSWEDRVLYTAMQIAPARKAYDETIISAQKVYNEVVIPAQKAYDETIISARKAYDEIVLPAQKVYNEVVITARKDYNEELNNKPKYKLE
jgi:hypothetical protein